MNKTLLNQAKKAKQTALILNQLSSKDKNKILKTLAKLLKRHQKEILQANQKDFAKLPAGYALADRLLLTKERIEEMRESLHDVVKLDDPIGEVIDKYKNKNKLHISRVRVPLGVVGIIFEARPNIAIEIASLCIKTGNAVIFKGGKDAKYSLQALVKVVQLALVKHGLNKAAVQMIDPAKRELVHDMMQLDKYIDVIIPRGSDKLIQFVRKNSVVPVIETGAGVCHSLVTNEADVKKAVNIIFNAKVSRPSVCNALDTLVIEEKIAKKVLPRLAKKFQTEQAVAVFADVVSYSILKKAGYVFLKKANKKHYGYEFLDYKMSVKVVKDFEQGLKFVQQHTSGHSEAIITEDRKQAARFLQEIDAACVFANASTRFTDGFVFGLGAEIGVSTQKLHTRGPMGLEALTVYKWIIKGKGQIR